MSNQRLRFVHAANLKLDEPVTGIGVVTGVERQIAMDATLTAWERIVATCLAQGVDFLILAGNSFDHRNQSLRAKIALEQGLEQLAAHRIDVYIAPGHLDPISSWKRTIQLPPSAILIDNEETSPVALVRDGRVIATLRVIATPETDETRWQADHHDPVNAHPAAYRIGIVSSGVPVRWVDGKPEFAQLPGASPAPAMLIQSAIKHGVDYIACGTGAHHTSRNRQSWIHDPGPAQSLSHHISGSSGCSVVTVDEQGQTNIERIPMAPVRYEQISLQLDFAPDAESLAEQMALKVMDLSLDDCESIVVLNWQIHTPGSITESLLNPENFRNVTQRVESLLGLESRRLCIHNLHDLQRTFFDQDSDESRGLVEEFGDFLNAQGPGVIHQVRQELNQEPWLQRPSFLVAKAVINKDEETEICHRVKVLSGIVLTEN